MSPRRLIIMGGLTLALLASALWLTGVRRPLQQGGAEVLFVPALADRINDIEQVRIVAPGAATAATLVRDADRWGLAERDGYPIDIAKLRSLLLALAEARQVEAKTSNPELYDRLGVEDIAEADAGGVQVEIEGGGDPLRIVIGVGTADRSGAYARHADQAQSWQIDRGLSVDLDPAAWLQRDLLDIDQSRVESIEVQPADGGPILIERADDSAGDFRLTALPAGREQASDFVADATAGLLGSLRFDDVLTADAVEPDPATRMRTSFLLVDGISVAIDSWQADGRTLARFEAGIDDARAQAAIEAEQASAADEGLPSATNSEDAASLEADGDVDAGDAMAGADAAGSPDPGVGSDLDEELAPATPLAISDREAHREQFLLRLREQVDAMNSSFEGRVFVLPAFKAANLNRDLEGYLKPKS